MVLAENLGSPDAKRSRFPAIDVVADGDEGVWSARQVLYQQILDKLFQEYWPLQVICPIFQSLHIQAGV